MERSPRFRFPENKPSQGPAQVIRPNLNESLSTNNDSYNPRLVNTRIVCTIGPASNNVETLTQLIKSGMNVARLNFSHGSYDFHTTIIQNVREASKIAGLPCAVMLDTKGPEIRTGKLAPPLTTVTFSVGDLYTWVPEAGFVGDEKMGAISWLNIAKFVKPGHRLLVGDGLLSFLVLAINEKGHIECRVENAGKMGENKNVNVPGVVVDLPAVVEKDINDISFGVQQGVDMIAASFIRKAEDVREIRALPGVKEGKIGIISKIESQEGLDNFDEILCESDGIMVARGDLGVQIPIKKVATAQKMMIWKSNTAGKPVITATQMLESMITNPRPTRAEATDVANAVFDGSDCVMLSGETASGKYPVEAVQTMAEICSQAELDVDYRQLFRRIRDGVLPPVPVTDSIASSAVKSAWDISAKLLICLTDSGYTARACSKYRPACPIVCVTSSPRVLRQLLVSRGTIPFLVDTMKGTEHVLELAFAYVRDELRIANEGDLVIIVSGQIEAHSGSTSMYRVGTVPAAK